jgi:hypothetical protein
MAWSEDGRFLAGTMKRQNDRSSRLGGIVLWSLADNSFRRLTQAGYEPVFFHGGTRILFRELDTIRLIDVPSGEVQTVLSSPLNSPILWARIGPGEKSLCTVRVADEGDIWSLSLEVAGRP